MAGMPLRRTTSAAFSKRGSPGEEIKIIAMFFIGIDDHGVQTGLRHGFAQAFKMQMIGFIRNKTGASGLETAGTLLL